MYVARSLIRSEYVLVGILGVLEMRPHLGTRRDSHEQAIAMATLVLRQMAGPDLRR